MHIALFSWKYYKKMAIFVFLDSFISLWVITLIASLCSSLYNLPSFYCLKADSGGLSIYLYIYLCTLYHHFIDHC